MARICRYEQENRGSLELEIADRTRSHYGAEGITYTFSRKGLLPVEDETPFCLFEWQKISYAYIVESTTDLEMPVELRINDRRLAVSKERGAFHLLAGQFVFGDEVGETRIALHDAAGKCVFELCTEVFPQKMDYRSDYKAMMAEISEIIHNLAYDTLKTTFRKSRPRLAGHTVIDEWWGILDALFDQLIVHLGVIRRQPKHEIRRTEKVLPVEQVRTAAKKNAEWLRKNARYANATQQGIRIGEQGHSSHALSSRRFITYDTYENRFIAWAVKNIVEQLRHYRRHMETIATADHEPRIRRIRQYQGRLQGIVHESPFSEAGPFEKRAHFSTSLTRGAGYRDFMYIYLLLTRGLEIAENDIFRIESKNVSVLYEYWCFLKLVRLLKEQHDTGITWQDLVRIKAGRFTVKLEKGKSSKVVFGKKNAGDTTTIYFNREFRRDNSRLFTYNQRPDYAIEFRKEGYEKPFWYLLDAKYRFDEHAESRTNEYNVPQEAIGQLHRYRDAILHTEPSQNATYRSAIKSLGGIILYPYPKSEDKFRQNTYFKSIAEVNIGALPFLPSKSTLVADLLERMIGRTLPEEHYESVIGMDSSDYEAARESWKERVTIGVIPADRQQERLQFIADRQVYHVPMVRDLHSMIYRTQKLLLCQAGTDRAVLYDVVRWEVLSARELQQLGTAWPHRAEKYTAFHLSPVRQLTVPVNAVPLKFRYTTVEALSRYLQDPACDSQALYLTNPSAARLYRALKQLELSFRIAWDEDTGDPSAIAFTVGSHRFTSAATFPDSHFRHHNDLLPLKAVLRLLERTVG